MKSILPYCLLFSFLMSCQNSNSKYEEITLEHQCFEWDPDPYKFSQILQDSILTKSGPQVAAWGYSYIGDVKKVHELWDSQGGPRADFTDEQKETFKNYRAEPAMDYILERADSHRVVIINEAHHLSQHRVFSTQLLQGLSAKGFKHLGLESYFASPKTDSTLQALGYPTLKTGFYTKEPQFANLIRGAITSGVSVFGYESQGHKNGKEREINQARNIQHYLDAHPEEKVMIHCGFNHGYEGDMPNNWEKAMAGRVTEFTGLDPLTINQVLFSEKSGPKYEHPIYRLTSVEQPSVYVNDEGQLYGDYRGDAYFDLAIFHPRSGDGPRASWLEYDDREQMQFTFDDAEINCPCLVYAYKAGEEIGNAVPYDVQETESKTATLVLDPGAYEIEIESHTGTTLKTELER